MFDASGMTPDDIAEGTRLFEAHLRYSAEEYARESERIAAEIRACVETLTTEADDDEERNALAVAFLDGWFVGCLEELGPAGARPGMASAPARWALAMLKQNLRATAPNSRGAMDAGYFAMRTRVSPDVLRASLVTGVVFGPK